MPDDKKKEFDAACKEKLVKDYTANRAAMIHKSPLYQGTGLLVVTSPEELYTNVIAHYSDDCPPEKDFLDDFERVRQEIRQSNET